MSNRIEKLDFLNHFTKKEEDGGYEESLSAIVKPVVRQVEPILVTKPILKLSDEKRKYIWTELNHLRTVEADSVRKVIA